jgi:hypothetical protein
VRSHPEMYRQLLFVGTLVVSAALAGCTSTGQLSGRGNTGPSGFASPSAPMVSTPPAAVAPGDGTVVGGLYRCFGLDPALSGPPTQVAGSVSVFRGPNAGLPDEIVSTNGAYSLNLAPGEYDLVGHWAGSNLAPPMVKVRVSSGTVIHQDLDYVDCK